MSDQVRSIVPCVRTELLDRVVTCIKNTHSVKLVGIPEIGTTTLLKAFASDSALRSEFVIVYNYGRYDVQGFRSEIAGQVEPLGIKIPELDPNDLTGFLGKIRLHLRSSGDRRKVVWVFDRFHQNFASLEATSILTRANLTTLSVFAEGEGGMQFVVTYRPPLDPLLNEDWYLRDYTTFDVELFTEKEARELLVFARILARRSRDEQVISELMEAGGRYPPLLKIAAEFDHPCRDPGFEARARKVYKRLETYVEGVDGKVPSAKATIPALIEIARAPIGEDKIRRFRYDLARYYCYAEPVGNSEPKYRILSQGFGDFLVSRAGQDGGRPSDGQSYNQTVAKMLERLDRLVLPDCVVVGKYLRYEPRIRNNLKDWVKRIQSPLLAKTSTRENYLIWAAPGSGKTYLIQQTAEDLKTKLGDRLRFIECNLAKDERDQFVKKVDSLKNQTQPTLCLLDEIDARASEDWPYDACFPKLDLNLREDMQLVIVLIGSTPSNMHSMVESIRNRKKGQDLLDRVLLGEKSFEIPRTTLEDGAAMVVGQLVELLGTRVRAVEKLALFYILCNETLRGSPRQLSEFIKAAATRFGEDDERLRFHHLFRPEDDDKRFSFRKANEELVDDLSKVDVLIST